jgi:hypothetical protein
VSALAASSHVHTRSLHIAHRYASTYQMLRGTLALFTGFLTVLLLRFEWQTTGLLTLLNRLLDLRLPGCLPPPLMYLHTALVQPVCRRSLFLHHWLGMVLIAAGAAIVGAASLLSTSNLPGMPPPAYTPSPAESTVPAEPMLGCGSGPSAVLSRALRLMQANGRNGRSGSVCDEGGLPLSPESARALFGDAMVVLAQVWCAS